MRYLCAKCNDYFREPMQLNVADDYSNSGMRCPHCKTLVEPYQAYSQPWLFGVYWWVMSTVVGMYCLSIVSLSIWPEEYFISTTLQLIGALCAFYAYQVLGIIYTRIRPEKKDDSL